MRQLIVTTVALVATLGLLAACSSPGGTGGNIEGQTWKLTSQLVSGSLGEVPAGVTADAAFKDGAVAGSAGCNVYNGPATVGDATLEIGPLATTMMACQPPASDVETAYLANLANAATFTATTDALTIYDGSGATILVYEAGPANPLEGEWIVTGYNNGQEAVVSPIAGTELTAVFTADTVSGSSGCNTFTGGYTLNGEQITVGPLAGTMKACEQPIMDQETQFLAALQAPGLTVEPSGGTVTLRDSSGAAQVTLAPKS